VVDPILEVNHCHDRNSRNDYYDYEIY